MSKANRAQFVQIAKNEYRNMDCMINDLNERAHLACELASHKMDLNTVSWYSSLNKTGFTRLLNEIKGITKPTKRAKGKSYQFHANERTCMIQHFESFNFSTIHLKRYGVEIEIRINGVESNQACLQWSSYIANQHDLRVNKSATMTMGGKQIVDISALMSRGEFRMIVVVA